jgi:hypothetical protein
MYRHQSIENISKIPIEIFKVELTFVETFVDIGLICRTEMFYYYFFLINYSLYWLGVMLTGTAPRFRVFRPSPGQNYSYIYSISGQTQRAPQDTEFTGDYAECLHFNASGKFKGIM